VTGKIGEALRKALEPHKRGPKFKRNPEDKRIEELEGKAEELESFLKKKDGGIKKLREN